MKISVGILIGLLVVIGITIWWRVACAKSPRAKKAVDAILTTEVLLEIAGALLEFLQFLG